MHIYITLLLRMIIYDRIYIINIVSLTYIFSPHTDYQQAALFLSQSASPTNVVSASGSSALWEVSHKSSVRRRIEQ